MLINGVGVTPYMLNRLPCKQSNNSLFWLGVLHFKPKIFPSYTSVHNGSKHSQGIRFSIGTRVNKVLTFQAGILLLLGVQ